VFKEIAMPTVILDRGADYPSTVYRNYATLAGAARRSATPGMEITLDEGSADPVKIKIVALNGNGTQTTNENDLSLVAVVSFENFKTEFGGDLSGFDTANYKDIETSVAPLVGPIDVYKVHHHCSQYSTNETWLSTTKPKVAIISTGDGNVYRHPTADCLERLHRAGIKTYWTESGNGAEPDPLWDTVSGNIVIEVAPGAQTFTLTHGAGGSETYPIAAGGTPTTNTSPAAAQYAWSKNSSVYHFANCRYVQNISAGNLMRGNSPPQGKELHKGCPK
jgi:hypothetical protein